MSKKRRENNEIPSRYNKLAAAFNQAYNAVLQVLTQLRDKCVQKIVPKGGQLPKKSDLKLPAKADCSMGGWQTRWFVLEDGILSYYKSQDEVGSGCKGSIKVQACEIIVHAIDSTRLDLDIRGEQHLYLKAPSTQERQRWLVALGSSKACVHNNPRRNSSEPSTDNLQSKKSELRLYCDLLMQQVHMVKTAANSENGPELDKMDEATSLLTATCDTFINTLEECMQISNVNIYSESTHNELPVSPANLNSSIKKNPRPLRPSANES